MHWVLCRSSPATLKLKTGLQRDANGTREPARPLAGGPWGAQRLWMCPASSLTVAMGVEVSHAGRQRHQVVSGCTESARCQLPAGGRRSAMDYTLTSSCNAAWCPAVGIKGGFMNRRTATSGCMSRSGLTMTIEARSPAWVSRTHWRTVWAGAITSAQCLPKQLREAQSYFFRRHAGVLC
jgi:hypothetical protein